MMDTMQVEEMVEKMVERTVVLTDKTKVDKRVAWMGYRLVA